MKQVMEQYTSAIVAVLVASVILLFLGGSGNVLSEAMQTLLMGDGYENCGVQTGQAFDAYKSVVYPQIHTKNKYALRAEQKANINDIYYALTGDEVWSPLLVEGCWGESGKEFAIVIDEEGYFTINEPGIYWMKLCAEGINDRDRLVLTCLFVNER